VKVLDSQEVERKHSEFDIKPFLRGLRKYNPKKVICINQDPDGNIQMIVQASSKLIKSHKVDFSTMEEKFWI
tara:strand:+ start:567 stop:782 length:216 start_codon:yes stop_codon:yes gene_type:complete